MDYDNYYKIDDCFGGSFPQFASLFDGPGIKGKALDVGCGQGRNSIALARLGFEVTAFDMSKVGIEYLRKKAESENLSIEAFVGDMYDFAAYSDYDAIVLDSVFKLEEPDLQRNLELIGRIFESAKKDAVIYFCIDDNIEKIKRISDSLNRSGREFEKSLNYASIYEFEDKITDENYSMPYRLLAFRIMK